MCLAPKSVLFFSKTVVPQVKHASESLGKLVERWLGPTPSRLGVGPENSNKFLSEADAADPRATL